MTPRLVDEEKLVVESIPLVADDDDSVVELLFVSVLVIVVEVELLPASLAREVVIPIVEEVSPRVGLLDVTGQLVEEVFVVVVEVESCKLIVLSDDCVSLV